MTSTCNQCGAVINLLRADAKYCSPRCSQKAYRERKRAERSRQAMFASRRFVRARRKMPIQVSGALASSTNPRTWASFNEVQSGSGDGYGFMLGDGWGCYDLDHVTDAEAREFISTIPEPLILVERSISGDGVHVFVQAEESPGWRRVVDGVNVERYTKSRFIRMTGVEFEV